MQLTAGFPSAFEHVLNICISYHIYCVHRFLTLSSFVCHVSVLFLDYICCSSTQLQLLDAYW